MKALRLCCLVNPIAFDDAVTNWGLCYIHARKVCSHLPKSYFIPNRKVFVSWLKASYESKFSLPK